jgi:hypothetical protein
MSQEPTVRVGDLVEYDGESCRVLRTRCVSAFAMFQTADREVLLETLDGKQVGWVAENEVEKVSDRAGGT